MLRSPDFAIIHHPDQWSRVAHENTSLDVERSVVQLAWQTESIVDPTAPAPAPHAGLAFDPWCRLYHALPQAGRIEKLLWSDRYHADRALDLFAPGIGRRGEFTVTAEPAPLDRPCGLAVDRRGRLFVAESGARRLLVVDLTDRRLLRTVPFSGRPTALATDGEWVYVIVELAHERYSLLRLTARSYPELLPLPETVTAPGALAVNGAGQLFLVDAAGGPDARLLPLDDEADAIDVPFASGVVFVDEDVAVIARTPGADFLRFRIAPGAQWQLPHLNARRYDGRGIAAAPDGQVVYWSENGLMNATLARVKYETRGRLISFRLDSRQFQTRWGRLFIDACLPQGTQLKVHCLVADEVPDSAAVPLTPPANTESLIVHRPDLSPPLPPQDLVDKISPTQTLYRRRHGNEMPWQCPGDSKFDTYEAPVIAPPGRYLWLIIDVLGKSHSTPKIRSVRVEFPAQDLLRRLPRVFSQDPPAADFLQRYLAIPAGGLQDLDNLSGHRQVLLNPCAAPVAVLPWLGSLLGMELDQRWPERAQRRVLREAVWLFRYRGTVPGLKRFLEIYLGREIFIVEHFKVRGLGGAFLGEQDALEANSVLGAGFRIGGRIGVEGTQSISDTSINDAIEAHAHKFSVIVPIMLSNEQRAVIDLILEVHRPVHTVFDICSVDAGMRIGTGLHLGLTSIVGKSSGFGHLQVGASVLGRTDVLGRPDAGTTLGASRLGADSRVG